MGLAHVTIIAATTFPRFTEFSLETEMQIRENASVDICVNKPKDFNLMDEAYYDVNTPRDFHGYCGLVYVAHVGLGSEVDWSAHGSSDSTGRWLSTVANMLS